MKTGKSVKALFLAGLFVFGFSSNNAADAQPRQPDDCAEDNRQHVNARYNAGLVERFEEPRSYRRVIREGREGIQDRKEKILDLREDHRRF